MAKLLVFLRDNTHSDPAIDQSGCYKSGDIVVVMEDSHQFSDAEQAYPFKVVQVAGTKAENAHLSITDDYKRIPKSALRVPAMRRALLATTRSETQRRRRYTYTSQTERKAKCPKL